MSMTSHEALDFLTIENVRAWARSKAPDAVAGFSSTSDDCPLAQFLKAIPTLHMASVSYNYYAVWAENGRQTRELPIWAKRFVYTVDTCFSGPVTAEQVLVALDDAERYERLLTGEWSYGVSPLVKASTQAAQPELSATVVAQLDAILAEANEKVLVPA